MERGLNILALANMVEGRKEGDREVRGGRWGGG